MSVHVRILRKTHPMHTNGASVKSPAELISGTAVPSLAPDVNTAALFDGIVVSILGARSFASITHVKTRSSKRNKKARANRTKFDMMPAYAVPRQAEEPPLLLRTANTPLSTKAQEEMSDFEREYPW
jgi:hypothetical protein